MTPATTGSSVIDVVAFDVVLAFDIVLSRRFCLRIGSPAKVCSWASGELVIRDAVAFENRALLNCGLGLVGRFSAVPSIVGRFSGALCLDPCPSMALGIPELPGLREGLLSRDEELLLPCEVPCLVFEILPSRDATSEPADPVDDCELCRRGSTGRLLEVVVEATNFLPVGSFFSGLAGDLDLDAAAAAAAARFSRFLVEVSGCFTLPFCCELLFWAEVSSSESGTSTNLAVGRGPEFEGPLGFFKIGWAGGGRDDEGVRFAGAVNSGPDAWYSSCEALAFPLSEDWVGSVSCMLLVWGFCISMSETSEHIRDPPGRIVLYLGAPRVAWWPQERDKGWARRNVLPQRGQGLSAEVAPVTPPNMPPKVLEAASCRVL